MIESFFKSGRAIVCGLLFSLTAAAQQTDSISSEHSEEKGDSYLMTQLKKVKEQLDSSARKVDLRYIEVPEKPWRIILRYKENLVDVDYNQSLDAIGKGGSQYRLDWELCFTPPRASSIGFWVGYRGTGFSFSKSLAKNAGRYFSIYSSGAKYGFTLIHRQFNTNNVTFTAKTYKDGENIQTIGGDINIPSPVWINSTYLNGYYVFNGRRYSQAAAYNQSVIQRRSAGSFLAGATWYQSSFDYSDIENAFFMIIGHGIHRIKVHQANIGFGYGYNFVPARGLVLNIMAMPTLNVYNRVKAYKYDFNYVIASGDGEVDDYGAWNPQTKTWANGKQHKPITMAKEGVEGNDYYYWDIDPEVDYSMLQLNLDLRLGLAYNWKNLFVGAQVQYNNFTYKKDQCKVNLFDAYGHISLGVRL